jgi:predicted porin
MNKKLLTLAVAAAMAAPLTAMAEATMYGKVRLAVEMYDNELVGEDYARIQNYFSRLGVKGSEDLGNGLKGIYTLEFGVNIADTADEFAGSNPTVTSRNAFVGLAGNWGTFLVGRHDTPMKISTGSLDYFADTAGDNNNFYTEALLDRRANGTVAYVSPNMNGLTLAVATVPGENNDADGLANAYSAAAMYSNSGFFASGAYEAGDAEIDALGGVADLEQMRFGLGFDGGAWKIGGVYENVQLDDLIDDVDGDSYNINAAYTFGNNTVKGKYFVVEDHIFDDHDGFALGLDHDFSKRTQGYLIYTMSNFDVSGVDGDKVSVWGAGLNHSF